MASRCFPKLSYIFIRKLCPRSAEKNPSHELLDLVGPHAHSRIKPYDLGNSLSDWLRPEFLSQLQERDLLYALILGVGLSFLGTHRMGWEFCEKLDFY